MIITPKLLFPTSWKCRRHHGLPINSTNICTVTSASFKGAMEVERLGLITSILTLNGHDFQASCDKGIKKDGGRKKKSSGVHQMSDELTK